MAIPPPGTLVGSRKAQTVPASMGGCQGPDAEELQLKRPHAVGVYVCDFTQLHWKVGDICRCLGGRMTVGPQGDLVRDVLVVEKQL